MYLNKKKMGILKFRTGKNVVIIWKIRNLLQYNLLEQVLPSLLIVNPSPQAHTTPAFSRDKHNCSQPTRPHLLVPGHQTIKSFFNNICSKHLGGKIPHKDHCCSLSMTLVLFGVWLYGSKRRYTLTWYESFHFSEREIALSLIVEWTIHHLECTCSYHRSSSQTFN